MNDDGEQVEVINRKVRIVFGDKEGPKISDVYMLTMMNCQSYG